MTINNTHNGISDGRKVVVPAEGHNYHLFSDCYGIRLGQGYHMTVGHDVWAEQTWTVGDAIANSKFACRVCYKRAGVEIPAEADRVKVRAAARAERMARKAAKATPVSLVKAPKPAVTDKTVDELMAEIEALLVLVNLLNNAPVAA